LVPLRGADPYVRALSATGEARVLRSRFNPDKGGWKMAEWRRKNDRDTWHFCRNCSKWPTSDYQAQHTKPSDNELCNECKAKERNGDCKK